MDLGIVCPFCGSKEIFQFRRDADHGGGSRYEAVNDESCYAEMPTESYRPDVDLYHCGSCDSFFEPSLVSRFLAVVSADYIPISAVKERIEGLQETLRYETKAYKQMCISAQGRVHKASFKEMGDNMPAVFSELASAYGKLHELDLQIELLERLINWDSVRVPAPQPVSEHSSLIITDAAPERIAQFRGEYFFLSNFANTPVTMDDRITYPTAENAFQAQKTMDYDTRLKFAAMAPLEAKPLGGRIKLRSDWEDIKIGVMAEVVYRKFSQNPDAKKKLLATGGAFLCECNTWGDKFWGTDMDGNGENHLGKILMSVRQKLRKEAAK